MTGIHVRSKSQPRSAPGSNSLQRKQQPEKQVPRRHTLGGSAFRPPEDSPVNVNDNNQVSILRSATVVLHYCLPFNFHVSYMPILYKYVQIKSLKAN